MRLLIAALCLAAAPAATPAFAETPMTGAEFEAETTGETLTYDYGGGLSGTDE